VPVHRAHQTVGLPCRLVFGVRTCTPGNAGEIPPRPDPRRAVPAPRGIGEQMPVDRLPHLVGHVQADRFGEVITHPPAGLDVRLRRSLNALAGQPQPFPQCLRVSCPFMVGGPIRRTPRRGVTLHRPPQPEHRLPLPFQSPPRRIIGGVEFQADHRHRPLVGEVRGLGLTAPPRHAKHPITAGRGHDLGGRGCHGIHATTEHRHRTSTPTDGETSCRSPAQPDHTGAGGAVWHQPIDSGPDHHHLAPVLADALRPAPHDRSLRSARTTAAASTPRSSSALTGDV